MARDNGLSHVADNIASCARAPFTCEAASRITAPVLLTNGEPSPKFFHRIEDELERCLPTANRMVIPMASRTAPGKNPEFYGDAVLAFLGKQ